MIKMEKKGDERERVVKRMIGKSERMIGVMMIGNKIENIIE